MCGCQVQVARAVIHPSEIKETQRSPRDEKKYFHSERRGKVTGVSSPRQTQTQFNSSCHNRPSSIHSLQHWDEGLGVDVLASSAGTWDWGERGGASRSGGEVLLEEEEERRRQEQDVLREERARQLTRRVSLPACKSVHHMPAAFMPQGTLCCAYHAARGSFILLTPRQYARMVCQVETQDPAQEYDRLHVSDSFVSPMASNCL
jgi:hypothetical protein